MTTTISPFKFLDSYQKDDILIFFGREKETDNLYDALSGVKNLLVYGPSGAGKTSLIECGLRNQFSDADWFALTIRRGDDLNAAVFTCIREQLREPFDLDPTTKLPVDPGFEFEDAVECLFMEQYKPVYLLFDQFEELLIQGSDDEKQAFFTRLQRLIRYKISCRVLLVMREEFIGHLSEFEPLCPSIFQHRFRLEKMGRSNVQKVVQQILETENYQPDFQVIQPQALSDSILAKLPDSQREIELTHVQVFLGELWDRATAENKAQKPVLHSGLLQENDNLERVLDKFLKKQLKEMEAAHGEKVPLELLAAMISERHTKLQLSVTELANALTKNDLALQYPLPNLLLEMEQRRILRTLKSGEQTRFEISHDVLARVVGQNLTHEMKQREKAREIYRVYGERQGLLSQSALDHLRFYKEFVAIPEDLQVRILESEQELEFRAKVELEKAYQQAAEEWRRAEEAERLKKRANWLSSCAALACIVAIFFYRDADIKEKETNRAYQVARSALNKIYFYSENFGVAYDEETHLYGFIDKYMNTKIQYKYIEAIPFDNTGYAKVKKLVGRRTVNYLIDTLGREFRVANGIEYLDSSIQALDIRNSQITNLPLKIFKNKQLKILLLSGNKIKEISSEIGTMPNLLGVDLSNNELDSIPSTFEGLKNLNWLNLSENLLTHLPNEIGNLDNLSILDVGWNKITALPSTIGNLNSLTLLNLNGNYLSNLPSQIGGFRNIEFIDLSNNWIEQLPIEVGQLTKLIWLNCSNNRLVELPKDLGNLTNLRWIDVSYNFLKSIPNEFKNLKKLNWLILKNNLINDTEKQLINEYMTDCEVKDIESLEDLFKKYSLQLSEELQKTPIDTIETTHIYNRLSWNQLVRSQFSDAENTIRRGLKNKPDDIFLNANLPLSLILQNNDNKTKEAIQLYDSWKGKPFGELRLPFFRDAFLGDLKTFERSGIIPKHRIVDIEKLRRQILFH